MGMADFITGPPVVRRKSCFHFQPFYQMRTVHEYSCWFNFICETKLHLPRPRTMLSALGERNLILTYHPEHDAAQLDLFST